MTPRLNSVEHDGENWDPYASPSEAKGDYQLNRIRVDDLFQDNPKLHDPVIEGWIRECEVMNLIAAPKFGKSWLVYYLTFCVAMGWSVFGRHPVKRGRVLIIDLELHKSLIASRLQTVARALQLNVEEYADSIDVVCLRGDWKSMEELLVAATSIMPGEYVMIVVDSKYRLEGGLDENGNTETTKFYNRADRFAEITGAAVLFIHHQSKGDQSGKRVTDLGAGGGAQSRAADTHLALREHENEGVAVIEGAVRSFPPLEPLAIRWQFPLWIVDEWVDTTKLKGRLPASEERQNAKDKEGRDAIVKALLAGPLTVNDICKKASMGKGRFNRLIGQLEEDDHVYTSTATIAHNDAILYHLNDSDLGGGSDEWTTLPDHQTT
jgi:hypothetical protein